MPSKVNNFCHFIVKLNFSNRTTLNTKQHFLTLSIQNVRMHQVLNTASTIRVKILDFHYYPSLFIRHFLYCRSNLQTDSSSGSKQQYLIPPRPNPSF
jgi:hypothetical protein